MKYKEITPKAKELIENSYDNIEKIVSDSIYFSNNRGYVYVDDLKQELFIAIMDGYRSDKNIKSYINTVCNLRTKSYFVRENAQKRKTLTNALSISSNKEDNSIEHYFIDRSESNKVDNLYDNELLKDAIHGTIESLKPRNREIFDLYYNKDFQYQEISDLLDIPLGTVKSKIFNLKKMLQRELEPYKEFVM